MGSPFLESIFKSVRFHEIPLCHSIYRPPLTFSHDCILHEGNTEQENKRSRRLLMKYPLTPSWEIGGGEGEGSYPPLSVAVHSMPTLKCSIGEL